MKLEIGRGGPWVNSLVYGIFTPIVIIIAMPFVFIAMALLVIATPFLGILGLIKKVD